jgi:2-dehydropantoate 2-reductase
VFIGVKAHSLPDFAPRIHTLIGPETTVVSLQNGVPWWFFEMPDVPHSGMHLDRVDPGGIISRSIDSKRVVGSIVYIAAEITEPGVVRHLESTRVSLGEPDGSRSERCRQIAAMLVAAGLKCPVTAHLRNEIWVKLLGNMSFNPISALTRATLAQIGANEGARELVRAVMTEGAEVASNLGLELPVSIDRRIAGAVAVGEHKTSMLQDLEAGRPLELDAITGAVLEVGDKLGVPMPHTRAIYACTKLLAEQRHI